MNWSGKKILITAGPTREPIDPVRYISNHSSGKMGYALASVFQNSGAEVTLITGPTSIEAPEVSNLIKVETAEQMLEASEENFMGSEVIILAAAVADYRPKQYSSSKIKKKEDDMNIELVKNPDIAATLGQKKSSGQLLVGFALETDNAVANALNKLERKNLDLIILNSLENKGTGFGVDTNMITILESDNKSTSYKLKSKDLVAKDILDYISEKLHATA